MELKSQQYSLKSFELVKKRLGTIKREEQEKYKTFAKRFPSLIHTCGLEQAISFANSKKDYEPNFKDLEKVLKQTKVLKEEANFIKFSQNASLAEYLRLSKEALIVAGWLKKYAEALIEDTEATEEE